jgi:hypothetical protein
MLVMTLNLARIKDATQTSSELEALKTFIQESDRNLRIAQDFSEAKQGLILDRVREDLLSKITARLNSFPAKESILKEKLNSSFIEYVNDYINYIDACLQLTSYSLVSGETDKAYQLITSDYESSFWDATFISLDTIFEDFYGTREIVISQISAEFKQYFLEYFDPISQTILDKITAEKIYRQALELFENEEQTQQWLSTPKTRLKGKTPLEVIKNSAGVLKIEEILYQAEFGMVS